MLGTLLAPSVHLEDEVLRERVALNAAWPLAGVVFGHQVELLDIDLSPGVHLADVIDDSLDARDRVVFVQEDDMVLTRVRALRLIA